MPISTFKYIDRNHYQTVSTRTGEVYNLYFMAEYLVCCDCPGFAYRWECKHEADLILEYRYEPMSDDEAIALSEVFA